MDNSGTAAANILRREFVERDDDVVCAGRGLGSRGHGPQFGNDCSIRSS